MSTLLRTAHQLVPALAHDDAVSHAALELQRLLWSRDVRSDLFAAEAGPRVRAFARGLSDLVTLRRRDAVLLVHVAGPSAAYDEALRVPLRRVVVLHAGDERSAALRREQLATLARASELGLAGSEPLRAELEAAGFAETAVVPLPVDGDTAVDAAPLADAFARLGLRLPKGRARSIAVLSSAADDGMRPYGLAVRAGLVANGHDARYVGVAVADTAALLRAVRELPAATEAVVVEHEFGLFRDVSFIRALFDLWRRRIAVVVSFHEIEPDKFHHYRKVWRGLEYRQTHAWPLEILRIPWVALLVALRFIAFRAFASLLGALPQRLVVHSDRSKVWVDLLTPNADKVDLAPLLMRPLEGLERPPDAAEKRRLRERLGLALDAFIFVSPGFFFRRKRFLEVVAAAGPETVVVLSGTASPFEPEYFEEVRAHVAERGYRNVVLNTDWRTMSEHVAASDCVVLYYEKIFQSGIATQAIWAGIPCVFSDIPGFRIYEGAGLFARDSEELRQRMREVQRPEVRAELARGIAYFQRMLAPERQAPRLIAGLDLRDAK